MGQLKKSNGCYLYLIIFLTIPFLIIYFSLKENIYDKERRYENEIDKSFIKKLRPELITEFKTLNNFERELPTEINGNICPIQLNYNNRTRYYELLGIDHTLSMVLIGNDLKISYDINSIDYFIITSYQHENIGEYVNENGDKISNAYISLMKIFLYNNRNKKLYFITSNKGDSPKKIINKISETFGENWTNENILEYLMNNGFLKKKNINTDFYTEEYVEYLESNNFLGIKLEN